MNPSDPTILIWSMRPYLISTLAEAGPVVGRVASHGADLASDSAAWQEAALPGRMRKCTNLTVSATQAVGQCCSLTSLLPFDCLLFFSWTELAGITPSEGQVEIGCHLPRPTNSRHPK